MNFHGFHTGRVYLELEPMSRRIWNTLHTFYVTAISRHKTGIIFSVIQVTMSQIFQKKLSIN
jgi:Tfp pilus assembly protein PilX